MYRASWNADPDGATELEARVKLIQAAEGPCGQCLDFADGVHEDSVSFYPDRIGLWYAKLDYPMNTTGDFHTYRVRISGKDVQVFVDGRLAIDGKGKFTAAGRGSGAMRCSSAPGRPRTPARDCGSSCVSRRGRRSR